MTDRESNAVCPFIQPWVAVMEYAANLEREAKLEIPNGHPLYKKRLTAIAQRTDCDDVLFEVGASDFAYAVVHLSWTGEAESDPKWPDVEVFITWQDWIENGMKRGNRSIGDGGGA